MTRVTGTYKVLVTTFDDDRCVVDLEAVNQNGIVSLCEELGPYSRTQDFLNETFVIVAQLLAGATEADLLF
jgi:hypothetical protein